MLTFCSLLLSPLFTERNVLSPLIDSTNRSSIECIESSQFILCLDDVGMKPASVSSSRSSFRSTSTGSTKRRDLRRGSLTTRGSNSAALDLRARAFHLLTGGGSELFTSNRWFDKFMQFIVSRDGTCGLVIEHSGSEGITLIRFLHQFLQFVDQESTCGSFDQNLRFGVDDESRSNRCSRIDSYHKRNSGYNNEVPISAELITRLREKQVFQLKFDLDETCLTGIQDASDRVDRLIQDLDLFVLIFNSFGKEFIKSQFMSPDAFIQLSLQLTHYKVHRRLVSSYESAGTRQFRSGRVDNIRSCTCEALNWAQAMCDEIPDVTVSRFIRSSCSNSSYCL